MENGLPNKWLQYEETFSLNKENHILPTYTILYVLNARVMKSLPGEVLCLRRSSSLLKISLARSLSSPVSDQNFLAFVNLEKFLVGKDTCAILIVMLVNQ